MKAFSSFKQNLPQELRRNLRRIAQNIYETPVYRLSKNNVSVHGVQHIVFVCQGNICRSAFAEHWMRKQGSMPDLKIESCGLNVTRAIAPPPEALQAGSSFGVDLSRHTSKSIEGCDLARVDLIVAMQYSHWRRLIALTPDQHSRTLLLRDFAPFPNNLVCNIYDPFGQGQEEFDRCFGLMEKALQRLMARIGADSG